MMRTKGPFNILRGVGKLINRKGVEMYLSILKTCDATVLYQWAITLNVN